MEFGNVIHFYFILLTYQNRFTHFFLASTDPTKYILTKPVSKYTLPASWDFLCHSDKGQVETMRPELHPQSQWFKQRYYHEGFSKLLHHNPAIQLNLLQKSPRTGLGSLHLHFLHMTHGGRKHLSKNLRTDFRVLNKRCWTGLQKSRLRTNMLNVFSTSKSNSNVVI